MNPLIPVKSGSVELPALIITAVSKFIVMDWLGMRAFYISAICMFWLCYVYYKYKQDRSVIRYWGFKLENTGRSLLMLMPFLVVCIALMVLFAYRNHTSLLNFHMMPVMILYPLWGTVQQFMLTGIVADILGKTKQLSHHKWAVILLTSFLFGLIHYPHAVLMVFTFIMEIVFLTVYFKWWNLWALGISHGIIATFLLYYVLNRDLWIELFAWFQI